MESALGTGWAITHTAFNWIRANIPEGKTIVELGSGVGTRELARYYDVYSIEHDPAWMISYPGATCINAPIKDYGEYRWYDASAIQKSLPSQYEFLLVDGPPGSIGRKGLLHHFDMFLPDIPILVDDCNREEELSLLHALAKRTGRPMEVLPSEQTRCNQEKLFGVIEGASQPFHYF